MIKDAVPVIRRSLLHTQTESPTTKFPILTSWIYKENYKIETPTLGNKVVLPNALTWTYPKICPLNETTLVSYEIIAPPSSSTNNTPKEATRMIVIRRKKMKKHKLRKLRKKMKFEWAKLRQKREFNKEKAFQAVLIQQCKEAEAFSAEKYVDEKLSRLHEIVVPRYWKGKRLPEFLIRQKMGLPPK